MEEPGETVARRHDDVTQVFVAQVCEDGGQKLVGQTGQLLALMLR